MKNMNSYLSAALFIGISILGGATSEARTLSIGTSPQASTLLAILGTGYEPMSGARGQCLKHEDVNSIRLIQPKVQYNIRKEAADSGLSRLWAEITVIHTVQTPLQQTADPGVRMSNEHFQQRCGQEVVELRRIGGRYAVSILATTEELKSVPNVQITEEIGAESQAKIFGQLFTNLTAKIKSKGSSLLYSGLEAPVGRDLGEVMDSFRSMAMKSPMKSVIEVETRPYTTLEINTMLQGKQN
jgi:hypothetical protein